VVRIFNNTNAVQSKILKLFAWLPILFLIVDCNLDDNSLYGHISSLPSQTVSFGLGILGVKGQTTDITLDAYLTEGSDPIIIWDTVIGENNLQIEMFSMDEITKICSATVSGGQTSATVSNCVLIDGTSYKLRLNAISHGDTVIGSTSFYSFLIDKTPPTDPGTVTLYSTLTADLHSSLSVSPDISFTSSTDGQSGLAGYQVQIKNVSDGSVIVDWTSTVTANNLRVAGISLTNSTLYEINVRAIDNAGNTSSSIAAATTFGTQELVSQPYSSLPPSRCKYFG